MSYQNYSNFRKTLNSRKNSYAYFGFLLILLFTGFFPTSYLINPSSQNSTSDTSENLSTQIVSMEAKVTHDISRKKALNKQYNENIAQKNCSNLSTNFETCDKTTSNDKSSLMTNSYNAQYTPNFSTDERNSESGFTYSGTKIFKDNTTHLIKPNNYNLTKTPLQGQDYNLTLDINAYSPVTEYSGERDWDSSHAIDNVDVYAQGIALPQMNFGAEFSFTSFSFGAVTAANDQEFVGAIYTSTCRSGCNQIVPDQPIATTTTVMKGGTSTAFTFNFTNPVLVKPSDVLLEAEGGYVFFLIYPNENNVGGTWGLKFGLDTLDAVDDGPTADYIASSGAPPSLPSSANWFKRAEDYVFNYSASAKFNPYDISTKVSINSGTEELIQTNGLFHDNNSRSTTTDYRILYDSTTMDFINTPDWIPSSVPTYFNITTYQFIISQGIIYPNFQTSSISSVVNWTVNFEENLDLKSLEIPDSLSIVNITKDGSLLTEFTDYNIVILNENKTISMFSGEGLYRFNAYSSNQLMNATLETYLYDSNWIQSNSSHMGILDPTVEIGDYINATVTNLGGLDLIGGTLNSSIRDPYQNIFGNNSFPGYVDSWLDTEQSFYTDRMTFATYLDPNVTIGVWTFEFHWFNGTAAGATGIEIDVLPVTTMNLLSPEVSSQALESDILIIEVITYDQSHNSDWSSPGNVSWEFETIELTPQGKYVDTTNYFYNASVDLSILNHPYQPLTYQFNVSFIDGIYEHAISFSVEIFYRGSSNIESPNTINYGSDFNVTLTPRNLTNGLDLNNSNIIIDMDIPFEQSYIPVNGTFELLIYWNETIRAGNNSIAIRWNYNQLRNNASRLWVEVNFELYVLDDGDPIIISSPDDTFVDDQNPGNVISWTATDLAPDFYTINKNGSFYTSGIWENATTIQISVDGLLIGNYNFSIFIIDEAGNQAADWIWVYSRDLTVPNLVAQPSNQTYEEGTTGKQLSWTATDFHNDLSSFTIYENEGFYFSSAWISNSPITMTIRPLDIGVYNYTIKIEDDYNNARIHSVFITIVDTLKPTFSGTPSDFSYSEGTTGHSLTWIANDQNPGYYDLYFDESLTLSDQSWSSSGSIIIDVDGLSSGAHNYTIFIFDSSGNSINDTAWVTVATVPVFTDTTGNYTYIINTSDHFVSWTMSDTDPSMYEIYFEDVLVKNGTWTNDVPIKYNVTGLGIGIYNFTIYVNDTENNIVSNTLFVQVTDIPTIHIYPNDLTYDEDTQGHSLIWNATDSLPSYFEIYLDEILIDSDNWNNSGSIEIIVDGLSKGIYNYTIIIYDQTDNSISDSVLVIVEDNEVPTFIQTPNDATIIEGSAGNNLIWNSTDNYPLNYSLQINEEEILSGLWYNANNITYNIDYLEAGNYNITIFVYDESLNSAKYTVLINVTDDLDPYLNLSPGSYTYPEDSSGNILEWEAFDLHAYNYSLLRNDIEWLNGTWVSNETISIIIDGLTEGIYKFTIIISDASNNTILDTIYLTVTDVPMWLFVPDDIIYAESSSGNVFQWNATDSFPLDYEIYIDNIPYTNGTWSNETIVFVSIDGLLKGSYNIKIVIYDTVNNNNTHNFNLFVVDETFPTVISSSDDFAYFEGTTGNSVYWNLNDTYPGNYSIYIGGQLKQFGDWTNQDNITLVVDDLAKGLHPVLLYFQDKSNNTSNHTIWITVTDNTPPNIINSPNNQTYVENSGEIYLSWEVGDLYPNSYNFYIDGILNHTDTWTNSSSITIEVVELGLGNHTLRIQIFDVSLNNVNHTIWFAVIETTEPIFIVEPSDITISEVNLNHTLSWTAFDDYAGSYEIYKNGTKIVDDNWISNTPIMYQINSLDVGYHNFTIIIYDTSGNFNSSSVLLNVTDGLIPVFLSLPQASYTINENSINNVLTWEVNDTNPATYEIFINNISTFIGVWEDIIEYSIDYLNRGIYNITIIIFDNVGNYITDSIEITVLDSLSPLIIEETNDFSIIENQLGYNITWLVIDEHPQNYEITMNGQTVQTGIWINNTVVIYFVPALSIGLYGFVLLIYDDSGNVNNSTVMLTILDIIIPDLTSQPTDTNFAEGDSVPDIQWIAIDDHPLRYEIYLNTIIQMNTTWTSNIPINYQIDTLNKGVYNISIVIYDTSLNKLLHSIEVAITDETTPLIVSHPSNFGLLENHVPITINWTLTDKYPSQFQIWSNDLLILQGDWNSSDPIKYIIKDLMKGEYNFTFIAWDESFNFVEFSFTVSVLDKTAPTIISAPADQVIIFRSIGNEIEWSVFDNHPKTYSILRNEIPISNNIWDNNFPIKLILDDLPIGEYIITILIFDKDDNVQSHSLLVRVRDPDVKDTIKPDIDITQNVYPNDKEIIEGQWLDIEGNPIQNATIYISLFDGDQEIQKLVNFTASDGFYQLIFDYSNIVPGHYTWKIEFQKYLFQTQEMFVEFTIYPNSYIIELETLSELQKGKSFEIIAKVSYNNSREFESNLLSLNQLVINSGSPVGVQISFIITYLDDDNILISKTIDSQTANNGIAIVVLSADETGKIKEIKHISASVVEDVFSSPSTIDLTQAKIPKITVGDPGIINQLITIILDNLYLVLLGISIFLLMLYFGSKIRNQIKKRSTLIMDDIKSAHIEIEVIQSVQAIIVQTKGGLPVYDRQFMNVGVDSMLISGMSSAISSFLSELDKSHIFGFEIMERENLSISSHKLDHSVVVVISKRKLPFTMLDQIRKAHMLIENNYNLDHRVSGVQELNKLEVEELFERAGFKVGLLDSLAIDMSKIAKIKKNGSVSRLLRQKIDLLYNFEDGLNKDGFIIEQLISFLKRKNVFEDIAHTLVSLMYIYGGLIPSDSL